MYFDIVHNDFNTLINIIGNKGITKPREQMLDIISDVIEVFNGKNSKMSDYFKNWDDTEHKKIDTTTDERDISKKAKVLKKLFHV